MLGLEMAQPTSVGGLDRLQQPPIRKRKRRRDRGGYRPGPELEPGPEPGPASGPL
jgi:hypothetical protein